MTDVIPNLAKSQERDLAMASESLAACAGLPMPPVPTPVKALPDDTVEYKLTLDPSPVRLRRTGSG